MQPLLAARDIACRRGERLLFNGLTFELAPGEALHVTGPNGSGKTSLIRILAGLLRPFAGEVDRSGTIALLNERPALDPQLPLGRALGFWAEMDSASDTLGSTCERLGLAPILDVPVRYLSTGQLKRAGLARVIGQRAPVWLLDEPLNGLDREGVALAEALVEEHCANGGVAVIASHQELALPGATRHFDLTQVAA